MAESVERASFIGVIRPMKLKFQFMFAIWSRPVAHRNRSRETKRHVSFRDSLPKIIGEHRLLHSTRCPVFSGVLSPVIGQLSIY
jgi:hypothetical protein